MNRTTLIWVGLAVLSVLGAYSMRPVEIVPPTYEDTNEPLFAGFEDPNAAASLEVQTWDDQESNLVAFKVELADGKWVIPSHNNYPADGVERMGKAAASFIGVRKDVVRSSDPKEHGAFGVKAPDDIDAKPEEKGQRIVLKDLSGTVLADIIVGNDVEGRRGFKYVRYPDKARVYAVKLEVDVSTKFGDWIEKDLLHLERDSIVAVESNAYRVDEDSQRVVDNEQLIFQRPAERGGSRDWVVSGETKVPKGKELKSGTIRQVLGAMDRLKIVGVRPQPARLDTLTLQSKGFFVSPEQRRLYDNEGEISVIADDGVVYTLYFGEVTKARGLALTGGAGETKEEAEDASAHRYMFVNVTYDESKDTTAPAAEAGADEKKPDEAEKPAGEVKAGKERALQLRKRFDKWFYVISDSSFKQMRKEPGDYWQDVKADK